MNRSTWENKKAEECANLLHLINVSAETYKQLDKLVNLVCEKEDRHLNDLILDLITEIDDFQDQKQKELDEARDYSFDEAKADAKYDDWKDSRNEG